MYLVLFCLFSLCARVCLSASRSLLLSLGAIEIEMQCVVNPNALGCVELLLCYGVQILLVAFRPVLPEGKANTGTVGVATQGERV